MATGAGLSETEYAGLMSDSTWIEMVGGRVAGTTAEAYWLCYWCGCCGIGCETDGAEALAVAKARKEGKVVLEKEIVKQYASKFPIACRATACCVQQVFANTNDVGFCGYKHIVYCTGPCSESGWLNHECKLGPIIAKQVCCCCRPGFPRCACLRKYDAKRDVPPTQQQMASAVVVSNPAKPEPGDELDV